MIGVIANTAEHDIVREFFELFKTPWEFYRENRDYEVLLCAGDGCFVGAEKLVLCFGGRETKFDGQESIPLGRHRKSSCVLAYQGRRIPIYGQSIALGDRQSDFLTFEDSGESAAYIRRTGERVVARVGYDLFGEVRSLLTDGQPAANAGIPTLELHITFLKDLITGCGVSLVEIPPVPRGHQFIACLTHDVDHPSIRSHKWDHTVFGFLFRAIWGSLLGVICGRMSFRSLLTNWTAALKLPFVYLGVAEDFWHDFDQRYLELEQGLPSTFFFIPFKDNPGKSPRGLAPQFRAARYELSDLADTIKKLVCSEHEVGLHGIDAWADVSTGTGEIEEIRRLSGSAEIGVRVHWLYYDQDSPRVLEKVGAAYDSTIGYNETVGYRAGTTQAYKPIEVSRLLELPLHIMDTALFYPSHLALSPKEAAKVLSAMLGDAVLYGGCLTVNWHDRSLAPERLWGGPYQELIREIKARGAWFATAGQVISWFRKRRSVVFEFGADTGTVQATVPARHKDDLPGLLLRIHKARKLGTPLEEFVDLPIDEVVHVNIPIAAGK